MNLPAKNNNHITKMVTRTRHENKALQVALIHRFLTALDENSTHNPTILLTESFAPLVKEVVKLELKDQQIEAQKTINNTTNNLFLTVAQKALQEVTINDNTPLSTLERQIAEKTAPTADFDPSDADFDPLNDTTEADDD